MCHVVVVVVVVVFVVVVVVVVVVVGVEILSVLHHAGTSIGRVTSSEAPRLLS